MYFCLANLLFKISALGIIQQLSVIFFSDLTLTFARMNSDTLVKILFLAADPSDASRLRLGQEVRDIKERLQIAKERGKYQLEQRESVRLGDITQAIFDV